MNFDSSENLCEFISYKYHGECLLGFSRGKDSIASFFQLKKYFKKITPVYFYALPDLQIEQDSIKYFEDYFQTKIIQYPHPGTYKQINAYLYQLPINKSIIDRIDLPNPTYEDFYEWTREELNMPKDLPVAIGVRKNDSPIRRMAINRYGSYLPNKNKFYPVYDWNITKLREEIKDVELPIDYKIFGKSLDGIDYRFIKPLKEYFPQDFEKVKEYFPLIELELLKYE